MSEWQPIETAPNDASILVHYEDGVIEIIPEDENDYDWLPYLGPDGVGTSPTHWMPLPEPPK